MTRHSLTGWSGNCRRLICSLASTWLAACGAFDGGQSGTDSLEAIGVHKSAKGCKEADKRYDVGDEMWRGCNQCTCTDDGKWDCVADRSCSSSSPSTEQGAAQVPTDMNTAPVTETRPAVTAMDPTMSDVPAPVCVREITGPSIGGSVGVYAATDARTTVCIRRASATELCMNGSMVDPGMNYENWGGGIGLVMASDEGGQSVPFDAPYLGITSVRFTLTGIDDLLLRAYVNQVDDPEISDQLVDYPANGFVLVETTQSGTFTLHLEDARLPAWTSLDVDNDGASDPEVPVDLTKLLSLQLFAASQPDGIRDFDVCVSDVEWLDINGNTVLPAE